MCGRDSRTKEWKVEKAKSDGARCMHYANYQSETSHITNIHESATKSQLKFLWRWKQSYSRLWETDSQVKPPIMLDHCGWEQTKSDMLFTQARPMMIEHLPGGQYAGTHAGGWDICEHKHTMNNFDSLRQLVTFILRQVHKVNLAKPGCSLSDASPQATYHTQCCENTLIITVAFLVSKVALASMQKKI